MGILRNILILLLFFPAISLFAQEEEAMTWSAERRLSWNDFKDESPASSPVAALTASGISYSYSSMEHNGEMIADFYVKAYFYPTKSWVQDHLASANILAHEQLHFDITELFARKFRAQLAQTRFTDNIKAEVRTMFKKINRELSEYQDRYDLETNSSRLQNRQREWQQKVYTELARTGEVWD